MTTTPNHPDHPSHPDHQRRKGRACKSCGKAVEFTKGGKCFACANKVRGGGK